MSMTMRREKLSSRLLLAGLCAVVLVASVRAFRDEYRIIVEMNGTPNQQVERLSDDGEPSLEPGGARTVRDLMMVCGRLITLAPRLKAEPKTAEKVKASCGASARFVLQRAPSHARALAVAVLSAPDLDAELYARAQAAAPHEPWALNLRLAALAADPARNDAVTSLAETDVANALRADWGRKVVARLYRDDVTLRPVVAAAAETLPSSDQQAFLATLQRMARGS